MSESPDSAKASSELSGSASSMEDDRHTYVGTVGDIRNRFLELNPQYDIRSVKLFKHIRYNIAISETSEWLMKI